MTDHLRPEDYNEPACPLCMDDPDAKTHTVPIDTGRMRDKVDEYLSRDDYDGAKRVLSYWLNETVTGNDERGRLSVLNEMMGLYRKCDMSNEALTAAADALECCRRSGLDDTVTGATTYINAATVYKAFGNAQEAIPLYDRAQTIYENNLAPDDERLGGAYNNKGLALTDLHRFDEARIYFHKAIDIMKRIDGKEPEQAISYLNLADVDEAEYGQVDASEKTDALIQKADELLETKGLSYDGNYAFVCEKCAPVFGHYGYFLLQRKYEERAESIYERA